MSGRMSLWEERLKFFKGAIFNMHHVGTFLPTGRALSDRLTEGLDGNKGHVVVEVGAGTGSVTETVVEKLHGHIDQYLGIELKSDYVQILRKRFPRLNFIQ